MNNFSSPENRLKDISEMTERITADKSLAGADFEAIRTIADHYEDLKWEMRRNSQTKMLVLNADVTKFLQQELRDLEASGTNLSTKNHRALKKLERALDFERDGEREYSTKNTRIGDGFFKNFFKSSARREADAEKVEALEREHNVVDSFVFQPENLQKTVSETTEKARENIHHLAENIAKDGILGGDEDFKNIREITRILEESKKAWNASELLSSETIMRLRAMMAEIWKNGAYYTDEHFWYLRRFEKSLYEKDSQMSEANRRNYIVSGLFASDARDRRDDVERAKKQEMTLNKIHSFSEYLPKKSDEPRLVIANASESSAIPRLVITNMWESSAPSENVYSEDITTNNNELETEVIQVPEVEEVPTIDEDVPTEGQGGVADTTEVNKTTFVPTEAEIQRWARNPMEISNETVKNFYIQRALNVVKSSITETLAKIKADSVADLELTGKMDERTVQGIKGFQYYINHFKYYRTTQSNEPLPVNGQMDARTMQLLLNRLDLTGKQQSTVILNSAIADFNNQ